jgi:3-oxoacyl-[acyl-carrier-protein] synthase II
MAAYVTEYDTLAISEQHRTILMAEDALTEALEQSHANESDGVRARLFVATPQPDPDWSARISVRELMLGLQRSIPAPIDWTRISEHARRISVEGVDIARPASNLNRRLGFSLPPVTITTACASGASAIQLAVEEIRSEKIQLACVVASDSSVSIEGLIKFALLSALSTRNEEPETACRPFSKDRDGFVMGEGAAAMVLESSQHASQRGAKALGYILGCGDATDNYHRTRLHPSGDAIVNAMTRALQDAQLKAESIDYINAHGTGTPENDKMEALGILRVFGSRAREIPVSSNKSMIGHTLAAAGAIEAVLSIVSMNRRMILPTINYRVIDPDIPLDVVPNQARDADVRVALSNSFGFGGQNVCLVLGCSSLAAGE